MGPDFKPPAAPETARLALAPPQADAGSAQGLTQHFVVGAPLQADWWQMFKSPALDQAVAHALANNQTLQAAEASLRVAQQNLNAGEGVFYPQVNVGLAAQRARIAPGQSTSTVPGSAQQGSVSSGAIFNLVTLSGTISYPLDIFGGERRAVESLGAQVDFQRNAARAAYLTLTANVVNACIALAAYRAQIHSTEALIALQAEQLRSTQAQVQAGTAPYSNTLTQRSLIAASQAQLAPLRQKASAAEHLIALLQGDLPSQSVAPAVDFDALTLPTDLPISLPSALVHQRPDILASEAQLHAASANIGIATAAQYPSLTLNATYGRAGSSEPKFFGPAATFWSIGPSLIAPLFHGGTLRAQRQAALEAFDAAQANYRQTVLAAFAQVADAMQALEHDAQALQAQAESEAYAREALSLLHANYRAGLVAFLDVLVADVQYHSASIATLQAVAQREQDTVALFAALGGGWWNASGAVATAHSP